jgi:hypothetical protein
VEKSDDMVFIGSYKMLNFDLRRRCAHQCLADPVHSLQGNSGGMVAGKDLRRLQREHLGLEEFEPKVAKTRVRLDVAVSFWFSILIPSLPERLRRRLRLRNSKIDRRFQSHPKTSPEWLST